MELGGRPGIIRTEHKEPTSVTAKRLLLQAAIRISPPSALSRPLPALARTTGIKRSLKPAACPRPTG
jgi:hypothetical protein